MNSKYLLLSLTRSNFFSTSNARSITITKEEISVISRKNIINGIDEIHPLSPKF